jgi:hypothetical protein
MALQRSLLLLVASAALPSCAAVFRNSTVPVRFESAPPGATISVENAVHGETPTTLEVERGYQLRTTIEAPGYDPYYTKLEKGLNAGWVTWDVLTCVIPITLCIPLIVDGVSGAWVDVRTSVQATLRPSKSDPNPTAPTGSGSVASTPSAGESLAIPAVSATPTDAAPTATTAPPAL